MGKIHIVEYGSRYDGSYETRYFEESHYDEAAAAFRKMASGGVFCLDHKSVPGRMIAWEGSNYVSLQTVDLE